MSVVVRTSAANKRLTTVAALKAELDVTIGADDAYLAALVDQASNAVHDWCGRAFAIEIVRETIELPIANPSILPARWPLVAVVSATADGAAFDVADVESDDGACLAYRLDEDGERLDWPAGELVVTYQAGYALPGEAGRTLPHAVERAALILAKSYTLARGRDPLIRSETVEGAGSTDYFAGTVSDLPPEVEALLTPYRKLSFG